VKLNVNGYLNKSVVLQMYLYTKSADRLSQLLTLSTWPSEITFKLFN